ncbi:MAG: heme-binding protein [Gemmatimonadaceae bacterium]
MSQVTSANVERENGEPAYRLVQHHDVFDVREYSPYLVAEVIVPGPADAASGAGFQLLARYIFGKNDGGRRLPMTAPVTQSPLPSPRATVGTVTQTATGEAYVVQFVMPPGFTLATLPVPDDARIRLCEVPTRRVAVIRYSGRWTQANYDEHLAVLRRALVAQGIATTGEPTLSRYNAPYVPAFMRRNEIWLTLA